MTRQIRRRAVLGGIGAVTAGGLLAGCSTETGDGDGGGDGGSGDGNGGGDGDGSGETVEAPDDVAEYLSDADNFDGEMVDMTGADESTVDVGAEGNGGYFAFAPPAIQVSTGTTVVWEWTGEGGLHNVVHEDGEFSSGDAVDDAEATYEYAFEESGTYLYVCEPHQAQGMKGAVVVE